MNRSRMMVFLAMMALLMAGSAQAQDCSGFDPGCPYYVFAATVSTPVCPGNSEWDDESASCWKPCSTFNTDNTTYAPLEDDPSVCAPSCPEGMTGRPGNDLFSTQCIICLPGSQIVSGPKFQWVCRRGGQMKKPLSSITLSYKPREEAGSACNETSVYVNGVCAQCKSPDTYLQDDTFTNGVRQYMFWQADGATFCVPDQCCSKDSWIVERADCDQGDCEEDAPEIGL